ncbi:tRNA lysidine(34) synthetase TilS [Lactobacillaceae bacterium Scapto_B20]
MSLLKQFASNVNHAHWWHHDQPVVVAVSTGVDSMVLLDLLQRLRYVRPNIIVAHVNHQLRTASKEESRYLKQYCNEHQLTIEIGTWSKDDHPDSGVENAARQFRYTFFERVMKSHSSHILLTAHHQNDQAETVLMKLMRGGDIEQLTGIQTSRPFGNGQLVRPLLSFNKASLLQYAKQRQLTWYEDSTNQDDDVTRNRIRHHLLPMMQAENPRVIEKLTNYAEQLNAVTAADDWLLARQVERLRSNDGYDLNAFLQLPKVVQIRLIKWLGANRLGNDLVSDHQVHMIVQLLNNVDKPQGELKVNSHLKLVKTYGRFKLENSKNVVKKQFKINRIMVRLNHWYRINDRMTVGVFEPSIGDGLTAKQRFDFELHNSDLPLSIRPWHPGDKLTLTSGGHQKVSRVLINQKVPNADRKLAMVLVDQHDRILSVLGYKNAGMPVLNDGGSHRYRLLIKD